MKFLKSQKTLQIAAQVSSEFKIDPVTVLNAPRLFWEVRIAALEYIREEKKKEADKIRVPRGKRR